MLDGPAQLNALSEAVIGACVEVHRVLGPGLPESAYEEALCVELAQRAIAFERQTQCAVSYKGRKIGEVRLDLIVDGRLVVELKAVDCIAKIHEAQTLTYLRMTKLSLALLVNFNVPRLTQGIRRIVHHLPTSAASA